MFTSSLPLNPAPLLILLSVGLTSSTLTETDAQESQDMIYQALQKHLFAVIKLLSLNVSK